MSLVVKLSAQEFLGNGDDLEAPALQSPAGGSGPGSLAGGLDGEMPDAKVPFSFEYASHLVLFAVRFILLFGRLGAQRQSVQMVWEHPTRERMRRKRWFMMWKTLKTWMSLLRMRFHPLSAAHAPPSGRSRERGSAWRSARRRQKQSQKRMQKRRQRQQRLRPSRQRRRQSQRSRQSQRRRQRRREKQGKGCAQACAQAKSEGCSQGLMDS